MAWTFPYSAEELQVFLQETDEQLQTLEEGLLALERQGPDSELLGAIFRAAHTLKGSAGAVGHERMARLTHAMEDLLDGLRSGRLGLAEGMADGLLEALDLLGRIRRDIGAGVGGEVDVDTAVDRLETLAHAEGAAGPAKAGSAAGPADAPGSAEPQAGATEAAAGASERLLAVVVLDRQCQMPSIRMYQALMTAQECGRVVASRPTQAEIEREQVAERLEIEVAGCGPEVLADALRAVPDVSEVRVEEAERVAPPQPAAPQPTVRVAVSLLDNLLNLVGELVIDRTRLNQAVARLETHGEQARREMGELAAHVWRITAELQEEVMRSRLLPVSNLFRRFPRLVRDTARQLGKDVEFTMSGEETELDRSVLEEIGDPLVHLLRNAVDHGVESAQERKDRGKPVAGNVRLSAEHHENRILIKIEDDGAGIDPERLRGAAVARGLLTDEAARRLSRDEAIDLIFAAGLTTRSEATAFSGRGVGMDVVRKNIERLNGSVSVTTEIGRGTTFTIGLPLTLAIVRALMVRVGETVFALPLMAVAETLRLDAGLLRSVEGREVVLVRGRVLPLLRGSVLLGDRADEPSPLGLPIVLLQASGQPIALLVDALIGEQEVVVKALDRRLGAPPGIAGASILGDGRVALIVDPGSLLKLVGKNGVARVA